MSAKLRVKNNCCQNKERIQDRISLPDVTDDWTFLSVGYPSVEVIKT